MAFLVREMKSPVSCAIAIKVIRQIHGKAGEKTNAERLFSGIAMNQEHVNKRQKKDMAKHIGYIFNVEHLFTYLHFSETKRRYSRLTFGAFARLTGSCAPEFMITLSAVSCFT